MFLVGRSPERLQAVAADLKLRGATIAECYVLDARDMHRFPALLDSAAETLGGLDTALIAHGTLSDQAAFLDPE